MRSSTRSWRFSSRRKRLSYRVLKLRLQLDDDTLEALKEDLIYAKQLAVDEDGKVLVWTGGTGTVTVPDSGATEPVEPLDTTVGQDLQVGSPPPEPRMPRRRTPPAHRAVL